MPNVKASDVVIILKMLADRAPDSDPALAAGLDPEVYRQVKTAASTSWIPVETEARFLEQAVKILYPNDPRGLIRLGGDVSKVQFTGIYKVFLMIPSVSFIVKRISLAYKSLIDTGTARVENLTANSGTLVTSGLPQLSAVQRQYIGGVLAGVVELTGAKDVQIRLDEADPQNWKWTLTWK